MTVAEPPTERGRETRERILVAAARLFHEGGVSATSVDDVLAAAAAGKGQFYRYFPSKDELVSAVIDHQLDRHLVWQRDRLTSLDDWTGLEEYLRELAAGHRARGLVGACPLGSLALELTEHDDRLRSRLAAALGEWQESLAVGFARLADRGLLSREVSPDRLAATTLAVIQGAYLLGTVHRDDELMVATLMQALAHLRAYAVEPVE